MCSKMKPWIGICISLLSVATIVDCSWGAPGSGQYHIQTDEGPERYFRFQTDNGQFRKEKRLQDGTVIGTEAWIDAAGFLRQKDYIADTNGYRILKSKTVFVGQGRPIEDAIKSTKAAPAQSGISVEGTNGIYSRSNSISHSREHKHGGFVYSTTSIPSTTSTLVPSVTSMTTTASPPRAFGYLSPAEAAKLELTPYLGYDHYPDELPQRHQAPQPVVHIRHHSEPIESVDHDAQQSLLADHHYYTSTERPLSAQIPSLPSLSIEPPLPSNYRRIRPIAVITSTPAPIAVHEAGSVSPTLPTEFARDYSVPAPFAAITGSTTPAPGYHYDRSHHHNGFSATPYSTTVRPPTDVLPLDINSLEVLQPPHLPLYRRPRPQQQLVQSNSISSGYELPQVSDYDGVSATRNGFRYFLPRQYHEEEQVDEHKRAGSFGYIDPFGIRRVIYYNASPERGFVHRKNNRYVGLNATPYDPRPY